MVFAASRRLLQLGCGFLTFLPCFACILAFFCILGASLGDFRRFPLFFAAFFAEIGAFLRFLARFSCFYIACCAHGRLFMSCALPSAFMPSFCSGDFWLFGALGVFELLMVARVFFSLLRVCNGGFYLFYGCSGDFRRIYPGNLLLSSGILRTRGLLRPQIGVYLARVAFRVPISRLFLLVLLFGSDFGALGGFRGFGDRISAFLFAFLLLCSDFRLCTRARRRFYLVFCALLLARRLPPAECFGRDFSLLYGGYYGWSGNVKKWQNMAILRRWGVDKTSLS